MRNVRPVGIFSYRVSGLETGLSDADRVRQIGLRNSGSGRVIVFRADLENDQWGSECWIEWSVELDGEDVDRVEISTGGTAEIVGSQLFFEPVQGLPKDQK